MEWSWRRRKKNFMSESGLNRVQLLGRLGADPELRTTGGGNSVLKMRLATTESYLDRNRARQERTEWHNVVIWGKRGEALSKFLAKGARIFIEGGLRTSSYDDKNGNKRYTTEIVATNIILLGDKGGGARGGRSDESRPADSSADDDGRGDDSSYSGGSNDDDQIPF